MTAEEFLIVLTTMPADGDAVEFATTLVEERLAACVNVLGEMQSIYRWENGIENDQERQILIKTTRARLPAVWERVCQLHPYEVPEFLVLDVVDGNDAYLRWMREATTVKEGEGDQGRGA